ncbi:MAG: ABC transporter permease [Acidobacteria bacterium]|nr:ABC transporter permease [Acidobacteriota bacterium]
MRTTGVKLVGNDWGRDADMEEVVYSADSQLRSPGRFVSGVWTDLRVSPPVAWRLFLHSLRAGYRQSWLGYFWLLLPPLATTLTWVFLHSAKILDVGQTDTPYPIYVLTGALLWQVFAEALHSPLQRLSSARNILTKSRIPHEALLLAGLFEVLFNFIVRLVVLLPVLIWFRSSWSLSLLLAPFGVMSLLLLGFAIGLLLTPVGLLYQDVSRGLSLIVGFWFFLTPVIYPPPAQWPASLLGTLNPVTSLLVTTRQWLALGTVAPARGFAPVIIASLLCFAVGWLGYRLARPHLIARL